MLKDYLKLHFIVVIWGFTAILSVLISIPSFETVFYRTLLASLGLLWLVRGKMSVSWGDFIKIFLTGALVGLHWILFFISVNIGAASVGLAGLSTVTLWTAILEPLIRKRPLSLLELFLGIIVIVGLYLIFQYQADQSLGLMLGIASALLASIFSIFNAVLLKRNHHLTITFYGMIGACSISLVAIFIGYFFGRPMQFSLSGYDPLWLILLGLVCTVYPYSEALELLNRLSVFAASLSINMEPVYGILLAAVILDEHQQLSGGFYVGSAVLVSSIFFYLGATHWRVLRS